VSAEFKRPSTDLSNSISIDESEFHAVFSVPMPPTVIVFASVNSSMQLSFGSHMGSTGRFSDASRRILLNICIRAYGGRVDLLGWV
jgi:hypothetical protein